MDFDIIIIGGGPAGYVGAIKASQLGKKVLLVEKNQTLGGTCLNVGCIPSKALLHASELVHAMHSDAPMWGIDAKLTIDFSKMMAKKEDVVKKLTTGISYLFKKNKVTHKFGAAKITSPTTISLGNESISAKNILIASGSLPIELPFLPCDEKRILSSTGALDLKEIPKKLTLVGGGVIGLELGSVYCRLGTEVTVIEFMDRILPEFDSDVSKTMKKILEKDGFTFHLSSKVSSGTITDKNVTLIAETKEGEKAFTSDYALISIGRRPYTEGLGLENVGITLDPRGFIPIDENFFTKVPSILAVGDVAGPPMLAHKASEEAVAAIELLCGHTPKLNYAAIPSVLYTMPEVATVGFTEDALKSLNMPYKVASFPMSANSRYAAIGASAPAFIKTLSHPETKKLYGCTIIGPTAGDLIMEPTLAITHGLTTNDLSATIHPHPTYSEAFHESILETFLHF